MPTTVRQDPVTDLQTRLGVKNAEQVFYLYALKCGYADHPGRRQAQFEAEKIYVKWLYHGYDAMTDHFKSFCTESLTKRLKEVQRV